ncbi:MAG TPA: AsmA family protein [Alphaproteobacteria bacterium]|nr:AsmA family protein [Alphaproteobacteria bacterium]
MRLIKGLIYTVAGLAALTVVAGGGLIAYVQTADLGPLAIKLAKDYGHVDVRAQGPLNLKLFPNPELHAGKLTVMGAHGTKPLFEADKTDVTLRWGSLPLLWKGMVLENVSLQNPNIYLNKPKSGPANWEMASSGDTGASKSSAKPASGGGGFKIGLGKANISNMNVTYIDDTVGRRMELRGLNVDTDARDLAKTTMTAKGTINGQPLDGRVDVNVTDMDKVPLKLALALANLRVAAQGEVADQSSYKGDINVQSPDIRATYVAALGNAPAEVPSAPLSLTGHVAFEKNEVELSAFALKLGDLLRAGGELAVKTGSKPSAKGTLQVQGNNLRALAALGTGKANPNIPALGFSAQTTLAGEDVIKLTKFSAQLADVVNVGGDVTITPRAGKAPLAEGQVNLRAASTRALGQAFGVNQTLPAQPLALSTSFKGGDEWSLPDLSLTLSNLLSASANVSVKTGGALAVKGNVDISGNDLKTTAGAFGVANAKLPSTRFTVKADIAGDSAIELKNLSVNLPQLAEATGTAKFTPAAGNGPADLKANLSVKKLDLTALGVCAPVAGPQVSAAANGGAGGANAGSGSPFNNTPIDLTALKGTTFAIDVDVDNLDCARWPVTTFKGNMVNTTDKLTLNNINAGLAGGTASVNGSLSHSGTPALALTVKVANVPVEKFVSTLKDRGVELPINVDGNLSAVGASSQALASSLKGTLVMNADKGRIPYTNLLGGVSNVERLLNGSAPVSNGNGNIQKFVASYDISGGVAKTKEFTFTTDGAFSATGTGSIDIGGWAIDYTVTPQVAASNQIAVPVLIKGALSAPSIGPDPAFIQKLTGRLAKEGLKLLNVGGDKAGNIGTAIGGVLSGQGTNTSETKEMINKGLNNLLKNIGK